MPLASPVNILGNVVGAYNPKYSVEGVGVVSELDILQYLIDAVENAGPGIIIYVDNGWVIKGTEGITITEPETSGIYTVDIPNGGILESLQRNFTDAETEFTEDGGVIINIAWNTTDFNTSFTSALLPDVRLYDNSGIQRDPVEVAVTVQSVVALGTTITEIQGINGVGLPVRIKAVF